MHAFYWFTMYFGTIFSGGAMNFWNRQYYIEQLEEGRAEEARKMGKQPGGTAVTSRAGNVRATRVVQPQTVSS